MKIEALLATAADQLVTIDHAARLTEAARLLADGRVNLVVVGDDAGRMVGVVSKTDIVARISHCSGSSCLASVAGVMRHEVEACRPEESLQAVWARMQGKGFRQLPVIDADGRPLGVLTARDALQALLGEVEHEESLLRDFVMGVGYR